MNYKAVLSSFAEGLSNLKSTKQRSLLGLLGVVIGTASVIMLINIAGIVENQILQQFKSMGTNVFVVSMNTYEDNNSGFDLEQIPKLLKKNKDIKALIPVQSVSVDVDVPATEKYEFYNAIATTPQLFSVLNMTPVSGRMLSRFDKYESYTVAGNDLIKKNHLKTGRIVRIGSSGFSIIGFTQPTGMNLLLPFEPNTAFYISIDNAKTLVKKFKVSSLLGVAINDDAVNSSTEKLKQELVRHYPHQNLTVRTAKTIIDQAKKQAQLLTILLAAIGSIALVVGGIGVMNVMLVSVAQRKTEVGLRIALGATVNDIKMLFLSESVILCFIGGMIGTVLGLFVSAGFSVEMNMPFIISWIAIPAGISISVVSGILSGVYPASQAARMNPIEALRTE